MEILKVCKMKFHFTQEGRHFEQWKSQVYKLAAKRARETIKVEVWILFRRVLPQIGKSESWKGVKNLKAIFFYREQMNWWGYGLALLIHITEENLHGLPELVVLQDKIKLNVAIEENRLCVLDVGKRYVKKKYLLEITSEAAKNG